MRRLVPAAALAAALLLSANARAQRSPLPHDVIALDTTEGEKLLTEAQAKADFFKLVSTFVTQERGSYCGVASAVTVLNALPIQLPSGEPGAMYTQQNIFTDAARAVMSPEEAARGGFTLAQLGNLLQAHPVKVDLLYGSELSLDDMRARLAKNLATAGDFAIVNYQRGELGQESMGHITPVGAYHAGSDRFLLLDVARYKYPPHWVRADALHRAIATPDIVSGKSRGLLFVAPAGPMPKQSLLAPARRPVMLLGGIITAAFFVGLGVGILVGRATKKAPRQPAPDAN